MPVIRSIHTLMKRTQYIQLTCSRRPQLIYTATWFKCTGNTCTLRTHEQLTYTAYVNNVVRSICMRTWSADRVNTTKSPKHTHKKITHTHTQKELSDARTKKTRIEWLTAGMQHIRTEPNSMCRSICVYDFDKAQVLTMHF